MPWERMNEKQFIIFRMLFPHVNIYVPGWCWKAFPTPRVPKRPRGKGKPEPSPTPPQQTETILNSLQL